MQVFRFLDCEVDPQRRELSRLGQLVDVQPLIFDLLLFLLENHQRVVTKEEMLEAVWRSSVVSDSVVARAVMKLRRAIGDDAGQPTILVTVHRVGYRFAAEVDRVKNFESLPQTLFEVTAQPPADRPPQGLAITPFENLSPDASVVALLPELDHVILHLLGDLPNLASVPTTAVSHAWQAAQADEDPLRRACVTLNVEELATLAVVASSGQYTVRMVRGPSYEEATTSTFTGPNLLVLAGRVAEAMAGSTPLATDSEAQSFWQNQYARVLRLHRQGSPEEALELLELCEWHLRTTVAMTLVHGQLCLACGRYDDAHVQFQAAEQAAQANGRHDQVVEALLNIAQWSTIARQPEVGRVACDRALALARSHTALASDVPRVLQRYSEVFAAEGRGGEAVKLAERAVSMAQRVEDRSTELQCQLGLGRTLFQFRQCHRAADTFRRIIDRCSADEVDPKLDALLSLSELDHSQHRYSAAIANTHLARQMARQVKPTAVPRAARQEIEILVDSGQVEAAERLLRTPWLVSGTLMPGAPDWVARVHGLIQWKKGLANAAIETVSRLLERRSKAPHEAWTAKLACELHFFRLSAGLPDLPSLEDWLPAVDTPLAARCRAASLLVSQQRDQAKQCLWDVWNQGLSNVGDLFELSVDVAWLLLEDRDFQALEGVIAQVLEMDSEYPPARVLHEAYTVLTDQTPQSQGRWAACEASVPSLKRRHPRWRVDDSIPLADLLSRACV